MHQFRDPIHGFIEVSDLELKIINSPPFQRLRNIKQLATTYLVYHGAEHTRFGHSLGVMHLVSRAFNSSLNNFKIRNNKDLFPSEVRAWYEQILRLIALVHDLGHAPFSHGSEALFDDGTEHEDFTKKIIFETEIAAYIREIGDNFIKENKVDENFHITPELLWLIYGEKNPELNPCYTIPDFKFLKSFLDSELDCDKMDYLLRDSYYCGVNYGKYDLNRLLSSLTIYQNTGDRILHLAIERGGIHVFEEFVIARYFMFIQVYFHKTRRYLDRLLVNCISSVLTESRYPSDVNEYLELDDDIIYNRIKAVGNTNVTAKQFIDREVMSCVYETPAHSNPGADTDIYKAILRQLKKISDCKILEDAATKMTHKIPVLEQYDADSGKGIPILVPFTDKPRSISEESILLRSLIHQINIKRIYIDKVHKKEAKKIVAEFFKDEGDEIIE